MTNRAARSRSTARTLTITTGMTPAQVLAAINRRLAVNGTGGFTAAAARSAARLRPITITAAGLNGGVAVTVNTLLATDTAAQVATKINTALAGATGGADGISAHGRRRPDRHELGAGRRGRRSPATARRLTAIGYADRQSELDVSAPCRPECSPPPSTDRIIWFSRAVADNAIDIASSRPSLLAELGLSVGTDQSHQPADPKRGRAGADDGHQGRRQSDADGHVRHRRRRGLDDGRVADRAWHADRRHRAA